MDLLLNVIINTKPSVPISELDKYEQLNKILYGVKQNYLCLERFQKVFKGI